MYVNGLGPGGARGSDGANGSRPVDGTGAPNPGVPTPRLGGEPGREAGPDRVEISAEARALAESEAAPEGEPVGLLPQLVVRMRGRLAAHFHDRPEIMAETAARILESGDLWEAR